MISGLLAGFSLWKWIKPLLPLIAIVSIIGLAAFGIYLYVTGVQNTIAEKDRIISEKTEEITHLKIDIEEFKRELDKLKLAVESKDVEISRLYEDITTSYEQTMAILNADVSAEEKRQQIEHEIADTIRRERINKIRDSSKADLLLRLVNKNVQCYLDNWGEEGTCINGSLKENK